MKGLLYLDRSRHNFGAAAATVLPLLDQWEAIDWFVPTTQPPVTGQLQFVAHLRLCQQHAPKDFPRPLAIELQAGGWSQFSDLCQAVRGPNDSDWKLGPLKGMALDHGRRCGYSRKDTAAALIKPGAPLDQRCLMISAGEHFIFGRLGPELDFSALSPFDADAARFYFFYAHGDAIDAIEWQLAEPSAPLADNPFAVLLACYGSGYYPFMFKNDRVVLFRFV